MLQLTETRQGLVAGWPTLLLVGGLILGAPAPAVGQTAVPRASAECTTRKTGLAVGEALGVNLFVNRLDAWVLGMETQRVNFESWARNLRLGWEWDENGFLTNMWSHPLHGSQYFNAGRVNCLSYWGSVPLAFLGSWTWEYLGETNRPSLNDFFLTSLGGIALGEMSHRLVATIRDEQATGSKRITREVLAMLLNPVEGVTRLFRGDWKRVGPNPPGHDPGLFTVQLKAGLRGVEQDSTGLCTSCPTLVIDIGYGDPLGVDFADPFDVFTVHVQISPDGGGLNALEAAGRLYQVDLTAPDAGRRHALAITQRYDYRNYSGAYAFGAQSIEAGVLSRFPLPKGYRLDTKLAGDLVVMGAVDLPNGGVGERTYDFGPGAGASLEFSIWRGAKRFISLRNRAEFLHTVSGIQADHLVTFSEFELVVPLGRRIGIGASGDVNTRTSGYGSDPRETRQVTEGRVFLSWTIDP